ncbi:NADH-quinone oxidoreductase subunit I [Candidatus Saganbacteria bacterium]|nr:NADH-quinone oxidoreductase subunit I [Candidatus Saganbacteria bacterium]
MKNGYQEQNLFTKTFLGIYNLLIGLKVTLLESFKKPITIQYPDEKRTPSERFRGNLKLHREKCTSCMICANYCPNYCIYINYEIGEDKKRKLKDYTVDMGLCMYCNICVEVCPFQANYWDQTYERSVYDRKKLIERKDEA